MLAEARAVNAIHHPSIIDIFSFGSLPDGGQYFVMELLQGQSVMAWFEQKGRFNAGEVLTVLEQMMAALAAAHAGGVLHRDLKPTDLVVGTLSEAAPDCPPQLAALVHRLLEKKPEARPASAREVLAELARLRVDLRGADTARMPVLRSRPPKPAPVAMPATEQELAPVPERRATPWRVIGLGVMALVPLVLILPAPALTGATRRLMVGVEGLDVFLLLRLGQMRPQAAQLLREFGLVQHGERIQRLRPRRGRS